MSKPLTDDEFDSEELERLGAHDWQVEMLDKNPGYVGWGCHEAYMMDGGNWDSPCLIGTWDEFNFGLDDFNEVVNFYFHIERDGEKCPDCDGSGYNPETKEIADGFYGPNFQNGWNDEITTDECAELLERGRLFRFDRSNFDSIGEVTEAVNQKQQNGGCVHDAINRAILIKTRAKRRGVYGHCERCDGHGHYYFDDAHPQLSLTLWVLHPRKGCSRGVEIQKVKRSEIHDVLDYLREAAERNANRFAGVMASD